MIKMAKWIVTSSVGLPLLFAHTSRGVTIEWDPSPDPVKGYKVYCQLQKTGASNVSNVGQVTSASIENLMSGEAYTFFVTAYDSNLVESIPSNAINFTNSPADASGAPTEPFGLAAAPLNSSKVKLSWMQNSTNESGFQVWRKSSTEPYAIIATVGPGMTVFTNVSLIAGPLYSYKICASNSFGVSGFSADVVTCTGPYAPSLLAASAINGTQIRFHWADNSTNETGFRVFRREAGKTYTALAEVSSNATEFVDSTVATGIRYYYTVSALGSPFQSGAASEATAVLPGPPAGPSGLIVSVLNASQVKLSWIDNATDESGFKIFRKADTESSFTEVATVGVGVNVFTNSSLVPGPACTYRICAYNTNGNSAFSGDVTTTTAPYAPSDLAVSVANSTQILFTWKDNSTNETAFRIFRAAAGTSYAAIGAVSSNVVQWIDTSTAPGIRYYYTVSAVGTSFQSGATNAVSIVAPQSSSSTALASGVSF